jgi:pyridoxal phosphate enzyme (YggS family)
MSTLKERLSLIQNRIAVACERSHRQANSVVLLPVSKTFDASVMREAVGLGLHRFGENRLQVIGSVQTNKAKEVAKYASELQSLDRIELALALDKRLQDNGRTLDVLVQVKTSPEESKSGLAPELLEGFLRQIAQLSTLRVKGFMTMAILSEDTQAVRHCFTQLRMWRDRMQALAIEGISLDQLSMGMSGDFEIAIEEGSTEIRVGSALFGSR